MDLAVPEYHLSLDESDWRWLRSHAGTPRCFEGALTAGGDVWPVWAGYRGRYSRWFRKPSFDIWFAGGRLFHGHTRLHLNAAYRDPSHLRGRLSLEVFASLGVPTPRAWHVSLHVNGEPAGLYTALEAVDAAWYARAGLPPGPIYYGVGSRGTFGLIDPETKRRKRYLAMGYEKCYPYDEDFGDLEELIWAIALPDDGEFADSIDRTVDVESFLRWLIGVEFMSHTDGLVQNYALIRPGKGRWQISPWDCDGTWGRVPNGRPWPPDEMGIGTGDDNYLAARLLKTPRWRRRYLDLWEELLADPLSVRTLHGRLAALYGEIRSAALSDREKRRSNSTFLKEPGRIRAYIAERTAFVRAYVLRARRSQ